jgi:hypothetical protein
LEEYTGASLSWARDDLLSLGQAEPRDDSPLVRSANPLGKTPLILILFDHANGLPESDRQLVAERRNIECSHDHQSRAVSMTYVSPSLSCSECEPKERTYSFFALIEMREEIRELIDWVFAVGLKEAERRGLGKVVDSLASPPTSTLRAILAFLPEEEELFIDPGL